MDGRQTPDPQPENANDLEDKEIIDLTQITPGEEDDVIALDDILEQGEPTEDQLEETIISLTDAIPAEDEVGADTEILNLTDVSAPPETIDEEIVPAEAEETIIDLMDMSTPEAADITETETPPPTQAAPGEMAEENLIDLMDVAAIDAQEEDQVIDSPAETPLEVEQDDDFILLEEVDTTTDEDEAIAEAAAPNIDDQPLDKPLSAIPAATAAMVEAAPTEPFSPSEAQVEATLERVITKIYGEKIEQMMIQTIEKTVRQEIEKIKTALIDVDDDSDG